MKDVIKLKQTESGFVEDENGVEYIRYSLVASMQKSVIDENKKLKARISKIKSKTAEQHPRKGLWDAKKVVDYIYHHAHVRTFGDIVLDDMSMTEFVETIKKAMEE